MPITGQRVLLNLLSSTSEVTGAAWFSITTDEATDVCRTEQLNLSIRRVSNHYKAHKGSLVFFFVPYFISETLSGVQSVLALYLKIGDILGMHHYVQLVGHSGF